MFKTEIYENYFTDEQIDNLNKLITPCDPLNAEPNGIYWGIGKNAEEYILNLLPKLPNETLFVKMLEATKPGYPHRDGSPHEERYSFYARTIIIPLQSCEGYTIVFNEDDGKIHNDIVECFLNHFKTMPSYSIQQIYKWNKGSMLIFDRKKMHSSNNWLKYDVSKKLGLVIWSEIECK